MSLFYSFLQQFSTCEAFGFYVVICMERADPRLLNSAEKIADTTILSVKDSATYWELESKCIVYYFFMYVHSCLAIIFIALSKCICTYVS